MYTLASLGGGKVPNQLCLILFYSANNHMFGVCLPLNCYKVVNGSVILTILFVDFLFEIEPF